MPNDVSLDLHIRRCLKINRSVPLNAFCKERIINEIIVDIILK